MSWYEIRLTRSQIREGVLAALQDEFRRLWQLIGEREDMALFAANQREKRDGQLLYISPGSLPWADSIVSVYFGSPCDRPKKALLPRLLVGHMEAEGLIE